MPYYYEIHKDFMINNMEISHGTSMPYFHYHNVYEMYYMLSGQKLYIVDDHMYTINPYELIILLPGDIHRSLSKENKPQSRLIFYFSENFFSRFGDMVEQFSLIDGLKRRKFTIPASERVYFTNLINRISAMDDRDMENPLNYSLMQCYLYEFLIKVNKYAKSAENQYESHGPILAKVLEYIDNNYQNSITLADAAESVLLSPTYLSSLFSKTLGVKFSTYLQDFRIRKATEYLGTTDESISAISQRCGFSTPSYFGDVFRRITGMSPTEFRRCSAPSQSPKYEKPDL